MNPILIISGHPGLDTSYANKQILAELTALPGTTGYDLRTRYPDGTINVKREQEYLRAADIIVLQFPFIWYGMPAHMRAWMESVFSYGFAFGEGGDALKGKRLLLSVTLGGNREAYSASGQHQHPVETFLRPLEMFARYCGMQYLPPVFSYAMNVFDAPSREALQQKVATHTARVQHALSIFPEFSLNHTQIKLYEP
jgi:putative NADPH-quinone reductase